MDSSQSKNVIETVLLAWVNHEPHARQSLDGALSRVEGHYQATLDAPLERHVCDAGWGGLALWAPVVSERRWPLWAADAEITMATSGVPTGWERVVGEAPITGAPIALAHALSKSASNLAELNPPLGAAVYSREGEEILIACDCLGAGRMYAMSGNGRTVWSNRLGALPLGCGIPAHADQAAWQVLAAAGWFLGGGTAIAGAKKLAAGTYVRARAEHGKTEVATMQLGCLSALVTPRRSSLGASSRVAAAHAEGLAANLAAAFDSEPAVALTGGRDSRVSAAAVLAAGTPATFNTGDQVPGELDTVHKLISAAPSPMWHEVSRIDESAEPGDDLIDRAARIHLMHDGMRNPQEVRRSMPSPAPVGGSASLSGHGGELGHGFYYHDRKQLRRLRHGGSDGLLARLEAAARRKHSAARPEAYARYMRECERTLEVGRALGLAGPALLDWFYLAQRLPYRSGLGARERRYSACVTPGFVRACFDLRPTQRLSAKLHRLVIAQLVPEWRRIPFFSSDSAPMPSIRRRRIWERPEEAKVLSEVIAGAGSWTELFNRSAVEGMWKEVAAGAGSADYEHVFYRVIWREAFDQHLTRFGI